MALTAADLTPTPERLETLKAYMKITWPEEDAQISQDYGEAVVYLYNADIFRSPDDVGQQFLYDRAVNGLVLNSHDRRAAEVTGTITNTMEFGLRLIINQLKMLPVVTSTETDTTTTT